MAQVSVNQGLATEGTLSLIKANTDKPKYDAEGKLLVSTPATDVSLLATETSLARVVTASEKPRYDAEGALVVSTPATDVSLLAKDATVTATNTALAAVAKDATVVASNTALGLLAKDSTVAKDSSITATNTALGLVAKDSTVAKDATVVATNTALGLVAKDSTVSKDTSVLATTAAVVAAQASIDAGLGGDGGTAPTTGTGVRGWLRTIRDTLTTRLPVDATTSRLAVALPPGASGLTDTELRATPLPVTQPLITTQTVGPFPASPVAVATINVEGLTEVQIHAVTPAVEAGRIRWEYSYDNITFTSFIGYNAGGSTLSAGSINTTDYFLPIPIGARFLRLSATGNSSGGAAPSATLSLIRGLSQAQPRVISNVVITNQPTVYVAGTAVVSVAGTPTVSIVQRTSSTLTSSALAAGASFTGAAQTTSTNAVYKVAASTDQPGTFFVEYSLNAIVWLLVDTVSVTPDTTGWTYRKYDVMGSQMRTRYVNGATPQGRFTLLGELATN